MRKACVIALAIMLATLTACGSDNPLDKLSKPELKKAIEDREVELANNETRIIELESMLKGVQEQDGPTAAISTFKDGTGRLTFNSIDGKLIFPVPFEYPESTQAPNTSSIAIADTIKVVPTSNWVAKLSGTSMELNHSTGVYGVFKVGSINAVYAREKMQDDIFAKFFNEEFPPNTIRYSKLFLDENWLGLQADTETFINEKPAVLRCGMVGIGNTSLIYMFMYDGERDGSKDEVVLSLLKTMQICGQSLKVE